MLRNDYIRVHPVMMQSIPALLEIWTPKLVRGPDIDSVTRQPSPEGAMFFTLLTMMTNVLQMFRLLCMRQEYMLTWQF